MLAVPCGDNHEYVPAVVGGEVADVNLSCNIADCLPAVFSAARPASPIRTRNSVMPFTLLCT